MRWPELIIATTTALCALRGGKLHVLERRGALYFGITWNEEHLLHLACDFSETTSTILVADRQLKTVSETVLPIRNVHQLLWHGGKLYVACTEDNQSATMDIATGTASVVYNSGGSINDRIGEDHVNSIWFDQDGLMYVVGHRQSSKFNRSSRIRTVRGAWIQTELYVGSNAHNVYVENDVLYVCDSSGWNLTTVGLETGERRHVDLGGFTRGFCRVPEGFVIGVSEDAPRAERTSGSSRLVLLDNELTVVDTVMLANLGGIQDLRALGVSDPSHNGIVFDLDV